MSAHAETMGPPPALSAHDRRMYRGGVWFVIMAEAMIFVTLFSTRFLLAGMERLVEPTEPIGVFITGVLVVSLLPAWFGLKRIAAGDAATMSRYLLVAGVLGFIGLAAVVYDWGHLAFGVATAFGENYVVSTGYHAVHIFVGALWLIAAGIAGLRGAHTRENHWVVEGAVVFWFFVVALWIALYVVFFVL